MDGIYDESEYSNRNKHELFENQEFGQERRITPCNRKHH